MLWLLGMCGAGLALPPAGGLSTYLSPPLCRARGSFLMSALMQASLTCRPADASSRGQPMLQ